MGLTQRHFVLVHGGGHGAWCWMRVIPGLEKAGHRVTTVDLYGAGKHPGTADDCTLFEQYNQPLVDLFRSFSDDEKVRLTPNIKHMIIEWHLPPRGVVTDPVAEVATPIYFEVVSINSMRGSVDQHGFAEIDRPQKSATDHEFCKSQYRKIDPKDAVGNTLEDDKLRNEKRKAEKGGMDSVPLQFAFQKKVILVGHSLGGMSLTYMLHHFPKNVSVAVYLSAFLPSPDGDYAYLYDMIAKDSKLFQKLDWQKCYKVEGGPSTSKAFSPADLKQYFYNGCTLEDIDIALKNVRTLPNTGVIHMPTSTKATEKNSWTVPKVYVLALADKIISPTVAHKMIEQNPPNEVIEINSNHSMFFHSVDITIKVLLDIVTTYD